MATSANCVVRANPHDAHLSTCQQSVLTFESDEVLCSGEVWCLGYRVAGQLGSTHAFGAFEASKRTFSQKLILLAGVLAADRTVVRDLTLADVARRGGAVCLAGNRLDGDAKDLREDEFAAVILCEDAVDTLLAEDRRDVGVLGVAATRDGLDDTLRGDAGEKLLRDSVRWRRTILDDAPPRDGVLVRDEVGVRCDGARTAR